MSTIRSPFFFAILLQHLNSADVSLTEEICTGPNSLFVCLLCVWPVVNGLLSVSVRLARVTNPPEDTYDFQPRRCILRTQVSYRCFYVDLQFSIPRVNENLTPLIPFTGKFLNSFQSCVFPLWFDKYFQKSDIVTPLFLNQLINLVVSSVRIIVRRKH